MNYRQKQLPTAVVMNMFYTGLGIARSLKDHGVPVIGLSSKRGHYGNFTRAAKVFIAPDSRDQPEELRRYLISLGRELQTKGVIFPTRDDDLVFLSRFRDDLSSYFEFVMPPEDALGLALDKWATYQAACNANVNVPRCWRIAGRQDLLDAVSAGVAFPCVLKPVSAYHWRQKDNWNRIGSRKAIRVDSFSEVLNEYDRIAVIEPRVLLQEIVPGGDEHLVIAACYVGADSSIVASFTARKVIQIPEGFGTGCIVEAAKVTEIEDTAARLLKSMRYRGIAEVEFKWNDTTRQNVLIEVNPRPWDQHRLGRSAGVDIAYLAYADALGLHDMLDQKFEARGGLKWVAEDVLVTAVLKLLATGKGGQAWRLLKFARGKRTYGIWDIVDPCPGAVRLLAVGREMLESVWRRLKIALDEGHSLRETLAR